MCPEELAVLVNTVAITVAKDKTPAEIDLIAVILAQISTTLGTISLQKERLNPKPKDDNTPPVPQIII